MNFYTFDGARGPTFFHERPTGFFEIYCENGNAIPLREHSPQFINDMIDLKVLVPVNAVPNSCLFVALTGKPYNPTHYSPASAPWVALIPEPQV